MSKKICLVGPDPKTKISGGVATHMRVLAGLSVFSESDICDIGSLNGGKKSSVAGLVRGFVDFYRKTQRSDRVLINVSIYPGSLVKLVLQLLLLRKKKNRIVFVFFHGGIFTGLHWKNKLVNKALKWVSARVSAFMFLTNGQMESFINQIGEFPVRRYRNYSSKSNVLEKISHDDDLRVLFVGRVTLDKGVFECLEAFKLLGKKIDKKIRLVFVGDGESLVDLKNSAKSDLLNNVEFKGYLDGTELEAEYRMADLVLLPSLHEGFPYVFIEAMQSGVPVIATRVGVFPEVITDGENGYLINRDVNEVALTIERHVENCLNGISMRDCCYKYFDENLSAKSAERFYGSLLKLNKGDLINQ